MLPRFQGCIVGLAVGDALGWPTEFIHDLSIIRNSYGPDGLTDLVAGRHPAGTYTDDTQMSIAIAEALVRAGERDIDSIASIAGSISGAYLGVEAIPQSWVRKIAKSEYLEDLSWRLAAKKEAING